MKPSPLQLKWVTYPEASYELRDEFDEDEHELDSYPVSLSDIQVDYRVGAPSVAFLRLATDETVLSPYRVKLVAIATFFVDSQRVRDTYQGQSPVALSFTVATNIARILYASAREQVAMLTARAPHGSMMVQSILIEPDDVSITSRDVKPSEVLKQVFGATAAELASIDDSDLLEAVELSDSDAPVTPSVKAPASKNRKSK